MSKQTSVIAPATAADALLESGVSGTREIVAGRSA
jgi:hypothetical protein